jgi:hypothetical protein
MSPLKKATEVTENTEVFSGNSASLRLCARLFSGSSRYGSKIGKCPSQFVAAIS